MLVNAASLKHIATTHALIVDISKFCPWNYSDGCWLLLDVFRSGTMHVEKRKFCSQYVQIKYLEASWPGALVAHRIQPTHGSMHAYTKRQKNRYRSYEEVQQQVHYDVKQRSQSYAFMLQNLMVMVQEYLLLSDDNEQCGALNSLKLVGSTAQVPEDNRICIWLEDVWSEP